MIDENKTLSLSILNKQDIHYKKSEFADAKNDIKITNVIRTGFCRRSEYGVDIGLINVDVRRRCLERGENSDTTYHDVVESFLF